jgi:hypothetical protein
MPLCDDFESDTVGSPPSSSLWTLVGTKGCSGTGNPSAPVIYPIVVDTTQDPTRKQAVKIMGGDSCGPIMLNTSGPATLAGKDVYGRFYLNLTSTSMTFDHTALMGLGLVGDAGSSFNPSDQASYLQLASEGAGNATNVFMWQTLDGNILPDKQTSGGAQSTYPMANTWTCIEFHTSPSGGLETWVNGTAIAGLTFVPGTTAHTSGVNDHWTPISPFSPTSLGFGWIVFGGPTMTLWVDDVALAGSRIGCP